MDCLGVIKKDPEWLDGIEERVHRSISLGIIS
jgi:hypothetical protein